MVEFLASLMTLITAFVQSGKPANLPPQTQQEVSLRGGMTSEAAKNLDPQNSNFQQSEDIDSIAIVEDQTPESPSNGGENLGQSISVKVKANLETQETTRIQAENTKSDKTMPTLIPQVAVDNSVALASGGEIVLNEHGPINSEVSVGVNESASFGQAVTESQPDSAKEDGQSFGQSTSEGAKENSRRP
ncbi:MAG: hypothetical protein HYT08_02925 [Candidatus Levybacteria bacterium]|nr:hypothetical protein [Candidatus Levybacteria bacterium]